MTKLASEFNWPRSPCTIPFVLNASRERHVRPDASRLGGWNYILYARITADPQFLWVFGEMLTQKTNAARRAARNPQPSRPGDPTAAEDFASLQDLKDKLDGAKWQCPCYMFGWVHGMHVSFAWKFVRALDRIGMTSEAHLAGDASRAAFWDADRKTLWEALHGLVRTGLFSKPFYRLSESKNGLLAKICPYQAGDRAMDDVNERVRQLCMENKATGGRGRIDWTNPHLRVMDETEARHNAEQWGELWRRFLDWHLEKGTPVVWHTEGKIDPARIGHPPPWHYERRRD